MGAGDDGATTVDMRDVQEMLIWRAPSIAARSGGNQQELPTSAVAMRLPTDCFPILFRSEDGCEIAVELKLKQTVVVLDEPRNA